VPARRRPAATALSDALFTGRYSDVCGAILRRGREVRGTARAEQRLPRLDGDRDGPGHERGQREGQPGSTEERATCSGLRRFRRDLASFDVTARATASLHGENGLLVGGLVIATAAVLEMVISRYRLSSSGRLRPRSPLTSRSHLAHTAERISRTDSRNPIDRRDVNPDRGVYYGQER
jgi:hypothetical protein